MDKKSIIPVLLILFSVGIIVLISLNSFIEPAIYGLKPADPYIYNNEIPKSKPLKTVFQDNAIDLSEYFPPPGNQGEKGSCVAFSIAYGVKSYLELKEEKWSFYKKDGTLDYRHIFSPDFIYNQLAKTINEGLTYYDALALVQKFGCVTWADMPYNPDDCQSLPSDEIKKKALKYRINSFARLGEYGNITVEDVCNHIKNKEPVLIACKLDEGFREGSSFPNIWKEFRGFFIGYHAMIIVGFDDSISAFKLLNSYGKDFGSQWICFP